MPRARTIAAAALLASISVGSAEAQSQHPTPGPPEATQQQQGDAAAKPNQPQTDQRGTEDHPTVVKILSAPKGQSEIEQDRAERERHAAAEWWTAAGSIITGIFTVVLAGSTVLLWLVTRVAARAADVAASASSKQAEAAIAVERPIFIIEDVQVAKGLSIYAIKFGNHGRTPAIIIGHCLALEAMAELPREPYYPGHASRAVQQDRVVGSKDFYPLRRKASVSEGDWDRILKGETVLWAYGYIDYLDFLKEERREGFCIGFRPARITDADKRYTTMPPSSVSWSRGGPRTYTYNQRKN